MDLRAIKRIAFFVNTVVLILVFALLAFFAVCGIKPLVIFSIPTALVYIVGFALISRNKLYGYVCLVFSWLTLYMGVTTLCIGYGCGFHLYCFSIIPVAFVTQYMSYKLGTSGIRPIHLSIAVALIYLVCTGYVARNGPLYTLDRNIETFFWAFNALCVFSFLIYYANNMIRSIIQSEKQLTEIAHTDRLTGLYNRHYMIEYLEVLDDESSGCLAMADIDYFKKINDVYGHHAGDMILVSAADALKNCEGCVTARWGGEEFLIHLPMDKDKAQEMLERLRKDIASEKHEFDGKEISVTVTIGLSERHGRNADDWIKDADSRLYDGKNSGRNRVVI